MNYLSLIRTMILLHEKERLKKPTQFKNRKIDRIVATPKNLSLARGLAKKILGRNLSNLPSQTKILFLLIEDMAERQCAVRKIQYSAFRFTRENVRLDTGWSEAQLKLHLNRLEALNCLLRHCNESTQVIQYQLLVSSKSVTRFAIDSYGNPSKSKTIFGIG